jgi:DNA-binding transcriptional MerR regulator
MSSSAPRGIRIGELSRRTGETSHVLRAWEDRYGLLHPSRTASGYRLYGPEDERRVRAVIALRAQGMSTGQAAAAVLDGERTRPPGAARDEPLQATVAAELITRLRDAMDTFDEEAAHRALDEVLTSVSLEAAVRDVVLPYLHDLGDRWADGRTDVAAEHFASSVIRRRLSVQALTWGVGNGPIAVLACPPGELHDLALLSFGLVLGRAGWRVRYLGQDTPLPSLASASRTIGADLVVLAGTRPTVFLAHAAALRQLAKTFTVAIAGAGASRDVADQVGARLLEGDPVTASVQAAALLRLGPPARREVAQ